VEVKGDERLTSIVLKNNETGEITEEPAAALFVFIGATAYTDMLEDIVERTEQGFIITGMDLIRDGKIAGGWKLDRQPFMHETSVPGIFAVGDVRDGSVKRVASAVGEGAIAVSMVHQYLKTV
jgi:thioredoxin reductase (NADPH)